MSDGDLLLEEDREFLERKGWEFDVHPIGEGQARELQIVIHGFPLPSTYTPERADLLVRQPAGYPEAGMDMFWTRPEVLLAGSSQKPNQADVTEDYLGLSWQRWSRHMNGWRGGIDNLETFLGAIQKELKR